MKKVRCLLILLLCICLSGCGLLTSGSHIFVAEHTSPSTGGSQSVSASNYQQFYDALVEIVEVGTAQRIISVERYDKRLLESDIAKAADMVCKENPIAAYAVKEIHCTIGTVNGVDAVSVQVIYLRDQADIHQIIPVDNMQQAWTEIGQSLNTCSAGLVLYVQKYEQMDVAKLLNEHALNNPDQLMEVPQVSVNVYPDYGTSRVVELKFFYQTSRESLKNMQTQVAPVFRSAALYVSGDAAQEEKFSQLYSFLMERYEYSIETSVTPTYSLLRHGVGDCRAFAAVYAAMCHMAGLDCQIVFGTRNGESWYWNIVRIDGLYFHVDLLAPEGVFVGLDNGQMKQSGYLWNFSAYPVCGFLPEHDRPVGMPENLYHINLKN